MRKPVIIFLAFICALQAYAGDGDYSILKISPALLKNANAVVRLEETRFEIISTKQQPQNTPSSDRKSVV